MEYFISAREASRNFSKLISTVSQQRDHYIVTKNSREIVMITPVLPSHIRIYKHFLIKKGISDGKHRLKPVGKPLGFWQQWFFW